MAVTIRRVALRMAGILVVVALFIELALSDSAPACILDGNCRGSDWVQRERADEDEDIRLIFAVQQRNIDKLHDTVHKLALSKGVSRKYMTLNDVHDLTADLEAEEFVFTWLNSNGFKDIKHNIGGFFEATHKVSTVDELLSAEFWRFYSPLMDLTITRSLQYSLPADLEPYIDFVGATQFPLTRLPEPCRFLSNDKNPPRNSTTPPLLKQFYSMGDELRVVDDKSSQSLFEALSQSFSPDDLTAFLSKYNIPDYKVGEIIGPNDPGMCKIDPNYCVEANLDVQYMLALCQAPTTYWSIPMSVTGDIFLSWILDVGAKENPPLVHSISYGGPETEFNKNLVRRVDDEIAKLSARGITVIVASGDDGVAGFAARNNPALCGFSASYPAQLPHVIAVGATMGPEYGSSEIACTSDMGGTITTGGGFSQYFVAPKWQDNAIKAYLDKAPQLPPLSAFNSKGRAYPDVSMMGHNYVVNIGGNWYQVSGSSASSPVFAALVTLINGERIKQGKPSLGWLTPILYQLGEDHPEIFNDVTKGRNNCCAGNKESVVCCKHGFTSTPGWDPVTGFGSVNYVKLKEALLEV
ncbi:tripeptidyl peptidase I precursor [Pelomyxa schiedti]|nr:tripeptidyl peptidase I precursor [Pelomyxa schiedti]